jgi:hypothetical protein
MDFLLYNKGFTTAQQQNIRCRVNKKTKELFGTELLILRAKGYYAARTALQSMAAETHSTAANQ